MSTLSSLARAVSYKARRFRNHEPGNQRDAFSKEKVIYLFRQLIHPIDTQNDLKFEHKASLRLTAVLTALFFVSQLLDRTTTAFLFCSGHADKINLFAVFASSVGLLVIWSACNWATCTISNGEGTFRDIWVMTTYSIVPYCIMTLLSVGLSYLLSADETIFYNALRGIGVLWTTILLFLGMMTAHQYTVLKTVVSFVLTILMIILSLFLMVVIYSILQQMWDFGFSLFKELVIR